MAVIERLIEKSTLVNWKGKRRFIAISGKGFTKRCLTDVRRPARIATRE